MPSRLNNMMCRAVFWCLLLTPVLPCVLTAECLAQGADGGQFDGAIWSFQMLRKGPQKGELRGRFRAANRVLYQKEKPTDPDFTKVVGKNYPDRSRTKVEFAGLRVFSDGGKKFDLIDGTALLTFDRFGEWSGTLIDGQGQHWDFKCSRVKE